MKTFKRTCIKSTVLNTHDNFTLKLGKEYITSSVDNNGEVMVFSRYWLSVPVSLFAKERVFTKG